MDNLSSTYLVAKKLIALKKCYIHDLKRSCKCNNPMQRVLYLRRRYGWDIATVFEGNKGKVPVYSYVLVKKGAMPAKFR